MKKSFYIFAACAAVLSVSCSKASTDTGKEEEKSTLIHMVLDLGKDQIQSDEQTKAYFVDNQWSEQWWKKDDAISVFPGKDKMINISEDGHNALFEGDVQESDSYTLLYPYDGSASSPRTGILETSIPTVQTLGEDQTCDPNALLSACSVSGGTNATRLQNYFSLVIVQIKGNDVTSVTLEGNNGEVLAGKVYINLNEETVTGADVSNGGATAVTLKPSGATFAEGEYGIAIAPTNFTKGFKIFYTHSGSNKAAIKSTSSDKYSVERNYGLRLPSFTLQDKDYKYYYILDKEGLDEWNNDASNWSASDVVYLAADVDYGESDTWVEHDFSGTFNGRGNTISGLTKPLFNNLYGSVRNLTVSANITEAVSSGANADGLGILARYASVTGDQVIDSVVTSGSIAISCEPENSYSVGGMLGINDGIPMTDCVNQASVTINDMTLSASGIFRVGGLTGSAISASANISECSNTGAVTVESATMPTSNSIFAVGGLVGYDTQANTVENSTNSGAVTVKALGGAAGNPYLMAGGIVGNATAAGFKLSGCENLAGGVVTIAATCSAQAPRVGGIIGRVGGDDTQITGCVNRALVDIKDADLTGSCTYGGTIGTVLGDNAVLSGNKNYGELKNASVKLDAVGGFAGYLSQNATVTDCENYGAVSSTAVPGNPQYLGGLVGKKAASKLIAFSNCKNEGDVTITCGEVSKEIFMGGIIAGCPGGNSTFSSCSNSGNITNNATKSTADGHHDESGTEIKGSITPAIAMGGIIGRVTDNAVASITSCTNSGDLNNYCGATDIRLGGIVGYTHQRLNGISGCTNSGLVSNNVLADYCYVRIGGILGHTNTYVSMSDNTNTGKIQSKPSKRVDICGLATYDDNVRLGGCIADYSSTTRSIVTGQVNAGEVVNDGAVNCGWIYIGGLTGYAESLTYQGSTNRGYIHNEATVRVTLNLSGILGRGNHKDQARVQSGSTNEGNVFNNGTTTLTRIGGICANAELSTDLSNCTNSGTIKNTGAATELYMGGVCAQSLAYVNLEGSSNSGDVIFEGSTSNTLFIAGVIGYQKTNVNSVLRSNTNSGSIICNAAVPKDLEIGGIAGEINGKLSNCTNSGPISVKANVGSALYLGGVVGWVETNANNPISDCENTAAGVITVDPGITITSQIWAGGVIGGQKKSIESINTNLVNRGAITFGSEASPIETSNTAYSYIGGVSGGNTDTIIAYENCENYGDMYYKGKHKCRLGGITSFAAKDPKGCICKADIRFYGTKGGTAKSDVGGIVAYYSAGNDGTFTDCLYKGDLVTNASAPRAYTGFLVGRQNGDACTFSNCKVGGRVKGVGSPYNTVALVCCTVSPHKIDVKNLVVATGTKRHDSVVNNLQLNFGENGSTPSVGVLCAGTTSETNTTTLTDASTGTMTDCTIGTVN